MAKSESRTQDASTPVVWLLTDSKPGHRNQLKGLGNRLRVLTGASTYWVDASAMKIPLWRAVLGSPPRMQESLPRPDLVVAAGSGTHPVTGHHEARVPAVSGQRRTDSGP